MTSSEASKDSKISDDKVRKQDHERCKKLIQAVNEVNRIADKLPKIGRGYELCNSYSGFPQLIIALTDKINGNMNKLYKNFGCKTPPTKDNEDLQKLLEANLYLDEKISLAIDHVYAELKNDKLKIQTLEKTATSHTGESNYISPTELYGKDSSGRYRILNQSGRGKQNEQEISHYFHGGLYVAKNIPKPQIQFQNCINNSDALFKPKLKIKHNAKDPKNNVQIVDEDGSNKMQWNSDMDYSEHPYDYELETFEIPKEQLMKKDPKPLKKLEEVEFSMITTKDGLKKLVEKLNKQKVFAVDLEHHSFRTFLGLTSLIQISTEDTDYIVDPYPIWSELWLLNEPFTNPNILKIFHGADEDILWLQRDFGIYVVNMFDTHIAMKTLEMSRLSLQYLVEHCCGITLGKELQKADWRIRPLSLAHLQYARSDTHYLIYCYEILRNILLDNNEDLLKEVYYKSKNLCRKTYDQPRFNKYGYVKLISNRQPNNQQLFALEKLWKWRDTVARQEDESPSYILPDQMLMQIAEVLPREKEGIIACCSPVPVFLKRDLILLHRIMIEARQIPLDNINLIGNITDTWRNTINTLTNIADRTPFEKRLEELFSCDCNVDLNNYGQEMETKTNEQGNSGVNNDKVFVIESSNSKKSEEFEKIVKALSEWVTPYEAYQLALKSKQLQ